MTDLLPPWKTAGVRYTPEEWEVAERAGRARANRVRAAREASAAEGHRLWAAGALVPWAITVHLDAAGLDGPQVDIDCGAAEPDVDHWEAGILYPTWEQTQKLADLCGVTVPALCRVPASIGTMFICGRSAGGIRAAMRDAPPPILTFTQHALSARLIENVDAGGRLW